MSLIISIGCLIFAILVLCALIYSSSLRTVVSPYDGNTKEGFKKDKEGFRSELYLAGPSKCFSCEASLPPEFKWQGRQTKCFDCEKQLAAKDPTLANYTHGTKCFDCESPPASDAVNAPPQTSMHRRMTVQGLPFKLTTPETCMDAGTGECFF